MQSQEVYGPQNNGYHRHNIHRSLNNHSKTFTLSLLAKTYNVSFILFLEKQICYTLQEMGVFKTRKNTCTKSMGTK